jgi:tetratricopeptide (TPR) repeat protein
VDALVEGTVLHSGGRLRVTVQLVRASPEEHLWAERYERDDQDIILLEQRLALAIAHEVSAHLTTAEETALTSKRITNPKAYDAYLHGRYVWNERTPGQASDAAAYFEQALREDPNFALAYSGLADHYSVGWGDWVNLTAAESYARKAVILEPGLAEAHAPLGIVSQYQRRFTVRTRSANRFDLLCLFDRSVVFAHRE